MLEKLEQGLLQECLAIIDGEVNFGDGDSGDTDQAIIMIIKKIILQTRVA